MVDGYALLGNIEFSLIVSSLLDWSDKPFLSYQSIFVIRGGTPIANAFKGFLRPERYFEGFVYIVMV